jgi:hypothetical protein
MLEGLWVVEFVGQKGKGAGVAVFVNGRILGGDGGYIYLGNYVVRDNMLTAKLRISNHLPGVRNVLGHQGDVDLELNTPADEYFMAGRMSVIDRPTVGMSVKLTKKAIF